MVKQFCGVIGQNGELINDGDFVELNSHYEFGITKFNDPYAILSSQLIEGNAAIFFITTDEVWDFVDKLQNF